MSYNANIPQPNDRIKDSQSQILNNFQAIDTYVGVNHVPFGTADSGKHNYVELPVQASNPPIVFPVGEIALYSFLNATTSQNELYINKQNELTTVQVPATASILSTDSAPVLGANGWSYLPSGILIKWGLGQATNPVTAQSFPTLSGGGSPIPAFTQIFSMVCTINTNNVGTDINAVIYLKTFTTTTYTVTGWQRTTIGNPLAVTFFYIAIGK
jgi:hypothetical protein